MDQNTMNELESRVPGWGVDRKPENRPGYPLYQEYRASHDTVGGKLPMPEDAVPLRGLSGLLRKAAYRVPDWKPRRWMMLMMADRLDAFEHNLPRNMLIVGGLGGLIAALAVKLRRR